MKRLPFTNRLFGETLLEKVDQGVRYRFFHFNWGPLRAFQTETRVQITHESGKVWLVAIRFETHTCEVPSEFLRFIDLTRLLAAIRQKKFVAGRTHRLQVTNTSQPRYDCPVVFLKDCVPPNHKSADETRGFLIWLWDIGPRWRPACAYDQLLAENQNYVFVVGEEGLKKFALDTIWQAVQVFGADPFGNELRRKGAVRNALNHCQDAKTVEACAAILGVSS